MCNLLKNEIRFCLSKKNILAFITTLLILPVLFYYPYVREYESYAETEISRLELASDNAELSISIINAAINDKEKVDIDDEELTQYKQALKGWQNELSNVNYISAIWNNQHYPDYYALLPNQYKLRDENIEHIVELEDLPLDYSTIYQQDKQDLLNRMQLRNMYESQGLTQEPNKEIPTGANILKKGIGSMSVLMAILLLFVLVINSDIWTNEFDANAYQLLFTLPISRFKIYTVRFAIRVLFTITTVGLLLVCFYGIGVLQHGSGLADYVIMNETAIKTWAFFEPLAVRSSDAVYPIIIMLGYQSTIIFCIIFCFTSVINFVSILCKNKGIALMIPSVLLMIVYMALTTTSNSNEFVLNPCGYLLTNDLLCGRIGVGYPLSVMILLLIGSCFYVSGYFIIYKDIQGE